MKPATMRWLDRRLGAVLCRLFARLLRLTRHRDTQAASTTLRTVLCIGLAEMGSIVLAAPAIRRLDQRGAEVFFLTFGCHRQAPAAAGAVDHDRVRVLRTDNLLTLLVDIGKFLAWARRSRFSAVVDLDPCMFFSTLLAVASGARDRAGIIHDGSRWRARNALYTLQLPYAPQRHMAESFAALVALLDNRPTDASRLHPRVRLRSLPTATNSAESLAQRIAQRFPSLDLANRRLVFLNPNAGDAIPQRRWDEHRFIELGARILKSDPDTLIGLIGSPADHPDCARIAAQLPTRRCANLAGLFDIAELPALFSLGHLLISNDSGPAHLAALTSLPVIVLFGPETPALYRPLGNAIPVYAGLSCSPCITPQSLRASACRDNRCMQAISVEQVHALAQRLLAASQSQRHRVARGMAA